MKAICVAIGLLFAIMASAADTEGPPPARTNSVAEMLQRKQEHQLREQLVKEGRLNEVRQLDEAQLRRQQVQTKQSLTRLNTELAREGTVELTVNGDGVYSFCAPGSTPAKPTMTKTVKPDPASSGAGASNPSY